MRIDDLYDEERVKKLRAEKERELQKRINETYLRYHKQQNGLKYSMIPEKYKKAEFSDLTITTKKINRWLRW